MLGIDGTLRLMHSSLMRAGFPYHSVSVIHRSQDCGFHVIFDKVVKDKVTDEIISSIENLEFTYSFVECGE